MSSDTPIRREQVAACLEAAGLPDWIEPLWQLTEERLSPAAHGDFERWHSALDAMGAAAGEKEPLEAALRALSPWRKGPFSVGGVTIDAEWQSNLKWQRLADKVSPLGGRRILDVGCGNGYYARRMRESGAGLVIGIDPTILYVMQHLAIDRVDPDEQILILPLRLQELPGDANCLDTTFSMGVLYHQRSPIDHLRELRRTLRAGGELVLETLVLPGDEPRAVTPADRYARMKNVWLLPTVPELETWLSRTGYRDVVVADLATTTTDEQRSTEWMPFESLAEALDPNDPTLTVEGMPAPLRVVMTATSP